MARSTPAPKVDVSSPEPVTLQEFCTVLSSTDRRVELIAGFHSVELQAGRIKDTAAAYRSRFEAFTNKPA